MEDLNWRDQYGMSPNITNAASPASESVHLNITMPDNRQVNMAFPITDTIWTVKQKLFENSVTVLNDQNNYGLYVPSCNGRAAKFLDDERTIKDYTLIGAAANLMLKYKQRTNWAGGSVNVAKQKKLNIASNQRDFMEIVRKNDIEKVVRILNRGFDPNFNNIGEVQPIIRPEYTPETPLTLSSSLSSPRSMMITLVSGGAFLDFRNKRGQTAMHLAVFKENKEAIKALLDLGSSPNYRDSKGLTPLFYASLYNKDIQCLNMLLHERAELDVRDQDGWTALHHAAKEGKVTMLEQLLFYGADINAPAKDGNTALHVGAKFKQADSCRILLLRAADKRLRNSSGLTASDIAHVNKYDDIYRIIDSFQASDVVYFTEMPTYNVKRRGTLSAATMKNLARSRSIPNINSLFSSSSSSSSPYEPISPPSTISISSLNNLQTNGFIPRPSSPSGQRVRAMDLSWINENKKSTENPPRYTEGFEKHSFLLQKVGNSSFGFTLKGTTGDTLFKPNERTPARNFMAGVEVGKLADEAGMRDGDFLVEINGTEVSELSHDLCVESIKKSGRILRLKVLRKKNLNSARDNEASGNFESSINKDLQATLDNFDKILTSSPATSNHENHPLSLNKIDAPSDAQTNFLVPIPPPPPPPTDSPGSFRLAIPSNGGGGERESGGGSSKPSTVRSSVGVVLPDATHDALMEAVRRRRELVDSADRSVVSENIENRISKSKKLRLGLGLGLSKNPTMPEVTANAMVDSASSEEKSQRSNTSEAKTLPKSFKKFHGDLSKSESLGANLGGATDDEGGIQAKTLPKRQTDFSSEPSGDFLAVAEMLRQNFLKKKQHDGSRTSLNEIISNEEDPEERREAEESMANRIKATPIKDDSLARVPDSPEPPVLDQVDSQIGLKLSLMTTEQLGRQKTDDGGSPPFPPPPQPNFNFQSKGRPAPAPPKKPPLASPQAERDVQATLNSHDERNSSITSSGGVDDCNPSPVSFGDLASMVAEKAVQMHKTSEEKGVPFVAEPPMFGTTKRYSRSGEIKKNIFKSDQFSPTEGKSSAVAPLPTLTSLTPRKMTTTTNQAPSVSEMSKIFSANAASNTKEKQNRPEKTLLVRPASQERSVLSKEFKPFNGGKFTQSPNKMVYSSAVNLQSVQVDDTNRKKTFKEPAVIPPPKEFASDSRWKTNGSPAGKTQTNGTSGATTNILPKSPDKVLSGKTSLDLSFQTSPDAQAFPTLRKTTGPQQQTSNTMVFKAKVTSTNSQKRM